MFTKNGFVRTMEASLAILFTAIVVVNSMPVMVRLSGYTQKTNFDRLLLNNPELRSCVLANNQHCVNEILFKLLSFEYNYTFVISDDYRTFVQNLPLRRVYVSAIVFAGNNTNYHPKILKIYYWRK